MNSLQILYDEFTGSHMKSILAYGSFTLLWMILFEMTETIISLLGMILSGIILAFIALCPFIIKEENK